MDYLATVLRGDVTILYVFFPSFFGEKILHEKKDWNERALHKTLTGDR